VSHIFNALLIQRLFVILGKAISAVMMMMMMMMMMTMMMMMMMIIIRRRKSMLTLVPATSLNQSR